MSARCSSVSSGAGSGSAVGCSKDLNALSKSNFETSMVSNWESNWESKSVRATGSLK